MRRATTAAPTQLALSLVREPSPPPLIEADATTLLQAMADLLLEALGHQSADRTGGVDEPEAHA